MRLLRFILLLLAGFDLRGATTNYYVATDGSDSNVGSLASPFLTLTKAQTTLRAEGPFSDGATVYVRAGTYRLSTRLDFTGDDSGADAANPIVWRGYPNETAVISGGVSVTNWTVYSGGIYLTDVSTQGLTAINFRTLWFNNNKQNLARYPNASAVSPYGYAFTDPLSLSNSQTQFKYQAGDVPHAWGTPSEVEIDIFPYHPWWNNLISVASVDAGTRNVTLDNSSSYAIQPYDRWFAQNVWEELDVAGEWYRNATTHILYFYPNATITDGSVIVPILSTNINFAAGTSNIMFRNFTVQHASDVGISMNGTTNIIIGACKFSCLGQLPIKPANDSLSYAVAVIGGYTNGVVGNDISFVGSSAIYLSGGTVLTRSPAKNYAVNNYIHDIGLQFKQPAGAVVYGVGNIVSKNVISSSPRYGVEFYGNDQVIEYNDVSDCMEETDDGGAINTFQTAWLNARGSVVRYNKIQHVPGRFFEQNVETNSYQANGIYLDGRTCGVDIFGNIVTDTSGWGLFFNGGSDNRATNNIVKDCYHGYSQVGNYECYFVGFPTNDAVNWGSKVAGAQTEWESVLGAAAWAGMRGMDIAPTNITYGPNGFTTANNWFFLNIVRYTNYPSGLGEIAWRTVNVYTETNFWQSNIVHYTAAAPEIYSNNTALSWADWQALPQDSGSITNDPIINANWTLDGASPALAIGFQQIPVSSIGCYNDDLRASWPLGDTGAGSIGTIRATTFRVTNLYQQ